MIEELKNKNCGQLFKNQIFIYKNEYNNLTI